MTAPAPNRDAAYFHRLKDSAVARQEAELARSRAMPTWRQRYLAEDKDGPDLAMAHFLHAAEGAARVGDTDAYVLTVTADDFTESSDAELPLSMYDDLYDVEAMKGWRGEVCRALKHEYGFRLHLVDIIEEGRVVGWRVIADWARHPGGGED